MAPSTLEQFIRFGTDAGESAPLYFTVQSRWMLGPKL